MISKVKFLQYFIIAVKFLVKTYNQSESRSVLTSASNKRLKFDSIYYINNTRGRGLNFLPNPLISRGSNLKLVFIVFQKNIIHLKRIICSYVCVNVNKNFLYKNTSMLSVQIEQLTEADRCQSRVESHFLHSFGSRFSAHSWDGEGVHVAQERKPLEGSGLLAHVMTFMLRSSRVSTLLTGRACLTAEYSEWTADVWRALKSAPLSSVRVSFFYNIVTDSLRCFFTIFLAALTIVVDKSLMSDELA